MTVSSAPAADAGTYATGAGAPGSVGVPGAPVPGVRDVPPTPRPAALTPYALRCEHRTAPLGVDAPAPRLAWRLASGRRGDAQAAYRVEVVALDARGEEAGVVWDGGRVESDAVAVVYAGEPLAPTTRYRWTVTVWGADDRPASAASWFETGLMTPDAWQAHWIARDPDVVDVVDAPEEGEDAIADHGLQPCPLLRHTFALGRSAPAPAATAPATAARTDLPVRARLYASARGLYELRLNGTRVGDGELTPGWTDYRVRVQYHAYDVTDLLASGENVLAATLADGWWSGFTGFDARRRGSHYGTFPQLIVQLQLDYADGRREVIATDEHWRTSRGATRYADLLMGECRDDRLAQPGWDRTGFDDAAWDAVLVAREADRVTAATGTHAPLDPSTANLVAAPDEPIRALQEIAPRAIARTGPRTHLVDLGQNFSGRVRLTVEGLPRGRRVTLRHGEALDDDGALYTANLRSAEATDVLIAAGPDRTDFEPRFTFHGFRYVEVDGVETLNPQDVTGVVLHSDTPWAGTFACDDERIRRLQSCIAWGQRGNFVSVPTDCPQRDERLGWLADAQVFLPTAALNADVAAFFEKWMADVRDAQRPDGGFTNVAPTLVGVADEGAPGWGDAGVLIPWHLYRVTGDERILQRNFDAMRAWVDVVHRHNPDLVWREKVGPHYSDWVAPLADADGNRFPVTSRELLATAYFARSAELTARAARTLGRTGEADRLAELASAIRAVFAQRFVEDRDTGRLEGDTQTAYLLALAFDLLPPDAAAKAAERLAEHVERTGHLTTGFIGVGLLAPTLDAIGRADLAHALLTRTERPSWLYSLQHGATTIWERWDGWSEEKGFQAPRMNSFNHYALGSVGEWLYRGVAGLDQTADSIGYRELLIRPRPGALRWARAEHASPQGHVAVAWERDAAGALRLDVEVPPGATAVVHVPTAGGSETVLEGGRPLDRQADIQVVGVEPGHAVVCRVGSGRHRFTAP